MARLAALVLVVLAVCSSALAVKPSSYTSCAECVAAGYGWSDAKNKCSPGFTNKVCAGGAADDEAGELRKRQQYLAKLKAENAAKAQEKAKELAELKATREAETASAAKEAKAQAAKEQAAAKKVKAENTVKVEQMKEQIKVDSTSGAISVFVWIPITMLATAAAIFVAHLMLSTALTEEEEEAVPSKTGPYTAVGKVIVRAGVEKSSKAVGTVNKGHVVVVTGTARASDGTLRAKIEEPEGWISVFAGSKNTKTLQRVYSKGSDTPAKVIKKATMLDADHNEDDFVSWGTSLAVADEDFMEDEGGNPNEVSNVDIDMNAIDAAPSMLMSARIREEIEAKEAEGEKGKSAKARKRERMKAKKAGGGV